MRNEAQRLVILNATLTRRDYSPRDDHIKERIPGSIWFDFKAFSHPHLKLSYMMPPDHYFIQRMKEINVRKSDLVVVYDKYKMISAPRAFWMLKTFGIQDAYLLNGTFSKWQREGRPIESGDQESAFVKQHKTLSKFDDFSYKQDTKKIRKYQEIEAIVSENKKKQNDSEMNPLLDSRVRKYYERGHIPTSRSLSLTDVLDDDFCYKKSEEMKKIIKEIGGIQNPEKDEVIMTCQRGITACIVDAAFRTVGNNNTSVYDGSYEEYAKINGIKTDRD
eukprot:403362385